LYHKYTPYLTGSTDILLSGGKEIAEFQKSHNTDKYMAVCLSLSAPTDLKNHGWSSVVAQSEAAEAIGGEGGEGEEEGGGVTKEKPFILSKVDDMLWATPVGLVLGGAYEATCRQLPIVSSTTAPSTTSPTTISGAAAAAAEEVDIGSTSTVAPGVQSSATSTTTTTSSSSSVMVKHLVPKTNTLRSRLRLHALTPSSNILAMRYGPSNFDVFYKSLGASSREVDEQLVEMINGLCVKYIYIYMCVC
jgi:hypothetical protein